MSFIHRLRKDIMYKNLVDEILELLTITPPESLSKSQLVLLVEEIVGDIEEKKLELE